MIKLKHLVIVLSIFLIFGCKKKTSTGSLKFVANAESFVANGFKSVDGFKITFTKVILNISDVSVASKDGKKTITLPGSHMVDFKSSADAFVKLAVLNKIPVTEYRRLKWSLKKLKDGEYKGYSLILTGKAIKGGKTIDFTLKFDEEVSWDAKEGYSGDIIKGIVKKGKIGEVEMTFHFDHIFGDGNSPLTASVNKAAAGFGVFAKFAKNNKIVVSQAELKEQLGADVYKKLILAFQGLGHSGEGHADILNPSTRF
jgi:hypothetical protein